MLLLMKNLHTAERVAENIKLLMSASGMTVKEVSKKSGVPERTIYSYLKLERTPNVDTTEDIAQAFGLSGWHLLMTNLEYDMIKSGKLDRLIHSYSNCPPESQEYLLMVSERDAVYKKNGTEDQ
jgi:transcriptional regulator with XRE-family HTH domain